MSLESLPFPVALLVLDPEGRVRDAIGPWRELAGSDPASLQGRSIDALLKHTGEGPFAELATSEGVSRVAEITFESDHGRYVVVFGVERLDKLTNAINQLGRFAGAGRMAGNIAHEFNNIFSAISGYVELARTTGKPDRVEKALAVTEKSIARAARLSKGLLLYGRRVESRSDAYSPANLVEDALLLAHKGLEKMQVEIVSSIEPMPEGLYDVGAIQHAFLEVLDNAKRFAGPNGRVEVSVIHEKQNDAVRIVVVDSGPGVPEPLRERIFESFFSGADDPAPGLGLGLAMARDAVETQGGAMTAGRDEQNRSAFTIHLPLRSAEARASLRVRRGS